MQQCDYAPARTMRCFLVLLCVTLASTGPDTPQAGFWTWIPALTHLQGALRTWIPVVDLDTSLAEHKDPDFGADILEALLEEPAAVWGRPKRWHPGFGPEPPRRPLRRKWRTGLDLPKRARGARGTDGRSMIAFSILWKQMCDLQETGFGPPIDRGLVRSLYVQGASFQSYGCLWRPKYPFQDRVADLMACLT